MAAARRVRAWHRPGGELLTYDAGRELLPGAGMSRGVAQTYEAHGVVVVGIGADGWAGLADEARHALRTAGAVLGSPRQLALLPPWLGATRVEWRSAHRSSVREQVEEHATARLAILASGDPLLYGIGRTLVEELGVERLHFLPYLSSVSLACARLGWPLEDVAVINVAGQGLDRVGSELADGRRLLVLSAGRGTPASVATLVAEQGYGASRMTVLSDLGSPREARLDGTAAGWDHQIAPGLTVVALECAAPSGRPPVAADPAPHGARPRPRGARPLTGEAGFAGLPSGAATELRALVLGLLDPQPGGVLWGVGPGSAAVALLWNRAQPGSSAYAIEDQGDVERLGEHARELGVPVPQWVAGSAPDAWAGLPAPDALFVAGSAVVTDVLIAAWSTLPEGGRLVAAATSIEGEAALLDVATELGGSVRRVELATTQTGAGITRWTAGAPVVLWHLVAGDPAT